MSRMLFVNLPVTKLTTSVDFFTKLGFSFNPDFTDEQTTCMLVGDGAFVMLLEHERFSSFTTKPIAASSSAEAILTISAESRDELTLAA